MLLFLASLLALAAGAAAAIYSRSQEIPGCLAPAPGETLIWHVPADEPKQYSCSYLAGQMRPAGRVR